MSILGNIFIAAGLIFILLGVYGIFRFKDFYSRILITAKVDTVGFITILLGIIFKKGISIFSAKVIIILLIALITTPLASHAIARSAYVSGYKIKKE